MKNLLKRVYNLGLGLITLVLVSGCGGGSGGGSLGFLSDVGDSISISGGSSSSSSSFASAHLPEPVSLLLLGSGLIGLAIYSRARL